jgi:MscS family membrane protein
MPNWTESRSFWLLNGQWLALFFLILVGFIFDKLIAAYSGRLAYRFLQKKGVSLPEKTKANFTRPIGYMALSGFWILTLGYIELSDGSLAVLLRAGKILFTFSSVAACLYFVDIVTLLSKDFAAKSENKFDDILVPLVSKTSKFLVFAIGLIFIGTSFTLDMKNLLAGLGIGGIAFALAAKDTISNLFGSLTVLLDRPFRIGDWVVIDGSVEGTIEEVGLRSTRVRTSYDSLITVPNGTLTNASIDNYGQRKFRRFNTTLGVQYDTPPEKIEAFCEGIRYIITTHKNTRKDYFHVYFTGMGDSALQVMLYVFFKVPDRSSELNARHHLLIDVLRLANEMQVEFAFPTQTLHLFNQATSEQKSLAKDYLDEARALGKNIAAKPISSDDHKSSIDNL